MSTVIGLDLSLTGTGYVVLDSTGVVLDHGTIKTKVFGMERLQFIKAQVASLLSIYEPLSACVEGYSMGSRAGQAFNIGELGGVIKLMLHMNKIPYTDVPPTVLKKFVTGKGTAMKDEIMLHVYKKWGWTAPDNNQADAYGLARMAWGKEYDCF